MKALTLALLLLPALALAADETKVTTGLLDFKQQASTPAAPRTGYIRSWIGNDGRLLGIDSASVIKELGGGGSSFNAVSPLNYDAVSKNLSILNNSFLVPSSNLSDLGSAATARTNLGLGTLATKNALDSSDIPNNAANTSGKAATADALATSPTQCATGYHAMGIAASGAANCVIDPVSGINQLTGEVTASGTGSVAATVSNAAVIGKTLTGFNASAGTISSSDTILSGLQKNAGNVAANTSSIASNTSAIAGKQAGPLTGDISTPSVSSGATTIANNAITTAKIADAQVTLEKLASSSVSADKLAVGAVDLATSKVTGVSPIVKGGTGAGTKQAAFNALSPITTKGGQITSDGTNNIELAACADGYQRVFDSTATSGFKCQLGNISLATNWVSYTPSFGGFGTPTNVNVQWSRVGNTLKLRGTFTAGTATASVGSVSLPLGLTTVADTPALSTVGVYFNGGSSNTNKGGSVIIAPSSGFIGFSSNNVIGPNSTDPNGGQFGGSGVAATGSNLSFFAEVPIKEWAQSTTANIYDSGDFGPISAGASVLTGTTTNPTKGPTTLDNVTYGRAGKRMNMHWDYVQTAGGAAGSGIYLLALPGGNAVDATIAKVDTLNGSVYCHGTVSNNADNASASTATLEGYMYDATHLAFKFTSFSSNADGRVMKFFSSAEFSLNYFPQRLSIDCSNIPIAGWSTFPVGVAVASQEVSAQVSLSSAAGLYSIAAGPVIFPISVFDQGGIYNSASGRFTAPVAGRYTLDCNGFYTNTNGNYNFLIYKNGVQPQYGFNVFYVYNNSMIGNGAATISLNAGDYVTLNAQQAFSASSNPTGQVASCTFKKIN